MTTNNNNEYMYKILNAWDEAQEEHCQQQQVLDSVPGIASRL